MKIRSRCGAVVVAASLAAGTFAIGIPTARADWDDCEKGSFCVFEHTNGSGRFIGFDEGTDDLGDREVFGGRMNDKTSAVWNRDVDPWCIFEHEDRGGHYVMVRPGYKGRINHLRSRDGFRWNDKVSSVRKARLITPPRNPGAAHWSCF